MPEHLGSCFCGAVRFRMTADPIVTHACHCRDCQKQTGGAFAINAVVEASNVVIEAGAPEPLSMTTESGAPHDIYRCPECRTAVWSDYGRRKAILFVRVTTLDEPDRCPPDMHIYVRSKRACLDIPAGAKTFDGFYDPRAEWPPEALERWRAALASS